MTESYPSPTLSLTCVGVPNLFERDGDGETVGSGQSWVRLVVPLVVDTEENGPSVYHVTVNRLLVHAPDSSGLEFRAKL